MSYDLEILVERRKHLNSTVIDNIRIEVNSQFSGRNRYIGTFDYMTEKKGAWCSLYETNLDNRYLSAFNIVTIKTIPESNICFPFWSEDRRGMRVMTVREEFKQSFRNVMHHLQNCSPLKRIMFLPRLQGGESNNVCGVISLEHFFELLENDKIIFNIAYIIQN